MIEVIIKEADSRQRVDKYIIKLLPGASKSLIYKQIRKKNITLNGKKISGSEILSAGDGIQFFFSNETFDKFSNSYDDSTINELYNNALDAYNSRSDVHIVYEDDNIACVNKPDNFLSQMADSKSYSINEWFIGYLISKGISNKDTLRHFKPSVLNRLDKNTTGMVICSKSLLGANVISELIRDRSLKKYYLTVVAGTFNKDGEYTAYHHKDETNNIVTIKGKAEDYKPGTSYSQIVTGIRKVATYKIDSIGDISLLEIELITGKSHQIRAHLAYLGYPVLGDTKYGNSKLNNKLKEIGIKHQMLHSYKIKMPNSLPEGMEALNQKEIICNPPDNWRKLNVNLEI